MPRRTGSAANSNRRRLIATGLIAILICLLHLGIARSLGWRSDRLHQAGLYRVTRNPQVLACALYAIGFATLWPSWYALGWALLYVPIVHLMVLTEEEHLGRAFGQEYEQFVMRVPRYL